MPELPEAEANRRRIAASCLNRTIVSVRHGKVVLAGSRGGPWIAVRLGMTGSLRPHGPDDPAPDFARLVTAFEGGTRLALRCPRKLGSVEVAEGPDAFVAAAGLGPDALDIDRETFASRIGTTRGAVKSALMAQDKIARARVSGHTAHFCPSHQERP